MKLSLLSIFIIISILNGGNCKSYVWEFGRNDVLNKVISKVAGKIGLLQYVKRIPLKVRKCYEATYVKVLLDNILSSPTIIFNKKSNVVTIEFRQFQYKSPKYKIIVKGHKTPNCESNGDRPSGVDNTYFYRTIDYHV